MITRRRLVASAGCAGLAFGRSARAAEAGITPHEILLGHTGILSGPLGTQIKALLAGAQLAFSQANAGDGLNGRRIRLLSLDDELKPEKAVHNYATLLEKEKVFAFFGCVGSGTTAAAALLLQDSGAPMIGGYAVADSARRKVAGSAYFVRAGTGREAQALVQHLTTLGITRIATVCLDNPGGQEAAALVQQALAEHQLKLQASLSAKGDGSNADDIGATLAKEPPQAVIMYLGGDLPAKVMKSHWAAGGNSAFYGMSIVAGEVVARALGPEMRSLVVSQVVPYPWGQVEPAAKQYRKLAEAANLPVGYYTYEGYVNAQVMIEALRRCGNELTRPRLHAVMRSLKQRIGGMELDFTDANALAGSRLVDMVLVGKDGHFTR